MKACRKRYKWKTPKDGRKYIDSRPFPNELGHLEMDFIVSKGEFMGFACCG